MTIPPVVDAGDFVSLVMVGVATITLGVSLMFRFLEGIWE